MHREDSDQTGRMPRSDWADAQAVLSSLGTQSFCWFGHEAAQVYFVNLMILTFNLFMPLLSGSQCHEKKLG